MSASILPLTTSVLPFALSYFLLAVVPGPNFAVVADAGLTTDRTGALSAAFGIAAGAGCLSAVVALSSGILVVGATTRQFIVMLFGSYLIFLALKSWGRAWTVRQFLNLSVAAPTRGHFRLAFVTAVANPTTALFVASSAPAASSSGWLLIAFTVFIIAVLWFGLVGLVVSSTTLKFLNTGTGGLVNFTFGTIFMLLGALTILTNL
jgi:threonine/homoserine/homoserine lactone efflux protein